MTTKIYATEADFEGLSYREIPNDEFAIGPIPELTDIQTIVKRLDALTAMFQRMKDREIHIPTVYWLTGNCGSPTDGPNVAGNHP